MTQTNPTGELKRVLLVYNTDYDAELKAASPADESAVQEAAVAVCKAVSDYGLEASLVGVEGPDLPDLIAALSEQKPDLIFNLCESMSGDVRNEVVLPSTLDMLKVPYTGPGPLAILLCLHKDRTKEALVARGVRTPAYCMLHSEDDFPSADALGYPLFLKLAHEDASVGIEAANVARDSDGLRQRTRAMWAKHKQPVLAEAFVEGREVNVTVLLRDGELGVLPLHEIDFAKMPEGSPHIVSYAAKWDENHSDYAGTKPVPMKDLSDALEREIVATAKAAFSALELRDFGRVDLRIDSAGKPWVIDVNPNCDLSPDAGVARAAEFAGISYPQLIGLICENAWRRNVR